MRIQQCLPNRLLLPIFSYLAPYPYIRYIYIYIYGSTKTGSLANRVINLVSTWYCLKRQFPDVFFTFHSLLL